MDSRCNSNGKDAHLKTTRQETPQNNMVVSELLLTGNLCHHCLRDPPVPQERLDLLLHHAAVPPADTQNTRAEHLHTLLASSASSSAAFSKYAVSSWIQHVVVKQVYIIL